MGSLPQSTAVLAGPVKLGRFRVGELRPDGVFWRRVQERHILRSPPALALDVSVLADLRRRGCTAVAFEMPDGGILTAPLAAFMGPRSIVVNRGFGAQRGVLLVDFAAMQVRAGAVAELLSDFVGGGR